MSNDEVVTAQGLTKRFKTKGAVVEAVRGVDFAVCRGEIFGFLGPNGAGKTTTQRMLTTLLPIDAGSARVAGLDVAADPRLVRSRIGYVSQLGGADDLATGRENLMLQARMYGLSKSDASRAVDGLLDTLDLRAFADRRAKTYSGGQRRRLDIGLGLVHGPEVLFLDEPSTGLDPQNRANLWERVQALRESGTTVFLTTHYLDEADALCDRVMIMDHGQIVADGTPAELKRQAAGDSVELTVGGERDPGARAAAALQGAPFIREISVDGDRLRLYVQEGPAALPDIFRMLDAERITVRQVSLSEPTLDDVFLARTGRSLRDAGGPGDHAKASEVAA
ncbi:MAG: ATP-binding cassette domain-containing protein [Acidobacteriota bacterium]|nr:ATP-binding cassette domain-containing protein [Acidobacteriota bacterium]